MERKKISKCQKLLIVQAMEQNIEMSRGEVSISYTLKQRALDWKRLADQLNASGGPQKDVTKWQRTWSDIKNEVRKKMKYNKTQGKNGGDPALFKDISQLDQRILNLNRFDKDRNKKSKSLSPSKCWSDIKSDVKKRSRSKVKMYLTELDRRVLTLISKTFPNDMEDIDSKESSRCLRTNEDTSVNEKENVEHSELEDSVDSSCVLALHDSYAESAHIRGPPVPDTTAAPVKGTIDPKVRGSAAPPVSETKIPPVAETGSLPSDNIFPDQTIAEVVVLDPKNCEKLIATEEASGAAIKSVAFQIGQLVKAESRKATALERAASAFERIADAVDRLSNNFCA